MELGIGNSNFMSTDTSFTCTPTTIPTIDGRRWISCFTGSIHFMSEVEIRVFNSNGQIVLTEVGSEYSILNLEGFKKGVYLIVMCGEVDGGKQHCAKQLFAVAN